MKTHILAVCLVFGGCSYELASPPARMVMLNAARTVRPGETVGGVKGAGHLAMFEPGAAVASAGVRHGVAAGIELDAEATWAYVVWDEAPKINRNIYAARAGLKASNPRGWAALLGGVGGGYAPAGGGFGAIDLGGVLSHPNCYVVPFGGGQLFVSEPIGAKRVTLPREVEGNPMPTSSSADRTYGFALATGIEIPLDHARCREGLTPARLQLGFSMNVLDRGEYDSPYVAAGFAIGVEFPF